MDFQSIWAEKYRPKKYTDLLLTKSSKEYFDNLAASDKRSIPHFLFAGKAGTGKTTLAKIIVTDILDCQYLYINASEQNSVDVVRGMITNFVQTRSIDGKIKVVFLDEADGLSSSSGTGSSAQQALKNMMEEYSNFSRFILTTNNINRIIEPIRSRCQIFQIRPEFNDYIMRCLTIMKSENITVPREEQENAVELIGSCYPDMRKALNTLQKFSVTGTFKYLESDATKDIAEKIFKMIDDKQQAFAIRNFVIENEKLFNGDYIILMKIMFEAVYSSPRLYEKKLVVLLMIAEAMKDTQIVLDQEINFFALIIKIVKELA